MSAGFRLLMVLATFAAGVVSESKLHADEAGTPDLLRDVLPLLKNRCVRCHGPAKMEGRLHLGLPQGIRRGGENGEAVVAGHADLSLLWKRVVADEMPEDAPLPPEEKAILKRWIDGGAPGLPAEVSAEPEGEEHWAFQELKPEPLPAVKDASAARNAVDLFVLSRLEAAGLSFNPEASRNTLIRRVSLDLTGLPPAPEEVDLYVNDEAPDAYEKMVERYLNSPRYGERWGKYWLDAAGYADSNGYFGADTDRPYAWRFRDFVIRSISADKPWDQFIREQIAGDELAGFAPGSQVKPEMVELLEAAHFMRNSPDGTDSSDGNPDEVRADKYAVLEGSLQIMGSSMLGVTVQCARCHDHKFEPFTQRDYYSLQAVIYPAFNVDEWVKPKERVISTATAEEEAAHAEKVRLVDAEIAAKRKEFAEWAKQHREPGVVLMSDDFDGEGRTLTPLWSNTVAGDEAPAGTPAIQVDSSAAPGAEIRNGQLHLIESGGTGDRVLSARQTIDWTPDVSGAWIQATFDLIAEGTPAPYVGYFIALRDFNDAKKLSGGNVLFDGNATGGAAVQVDYPGQDAGSVGRIGQSGYTPGRNYGVRVTNMGNDRFQIVQVVDGLVEEGSVTVSGKDLPDGGFGFEYCCGRSFVVDNVLVESSLPETQQDDPQKALAAVHVEKRKELAEAVKAIEAKRPQPIGKLALVGDLSAKPPDVRLLTRGSYKTPGEPVESAAPAFLSETINQSDFSQHLRSGMSTTGRRLALAGWLTQPGSRASALLAKVSINRWWAHHLGTGIVATPDNLGYSGSAPTHPELLNYLALQLMEHQWSARAIHRLILTSAMYRQSAAAHAEGERRDPQNQLLWRYPMRRLDAEAIRDSMLLASGELDQQMYGPYVPSERNSEGDVVISESTAGAKKRSIYLQQRRTQVTGILDAFDAPSIVFNCTVRNSTTVPLQSLKLLNSDFVRLRATAMAGLLKKQITDKSGSINDVISLAFRRALSRPPSDKEIAVSKEFLSAQPAQYANRENAAELAMIDFCQMLLASNAFLYVE